MNVCIYRIPHLTFHFLLPTSHLKNGDTTSNPASSTIKSLASHIFSLLSSLSFPSSHCPSCKGPIRWYDNIPLLSYVILMGRCRHCKAKISIQYPLVEFTTGVFLLSLLKVFGFSFDLIIYLAFLSALLVITVIDLKHMIIPNEITLSFIPLGLLSSPFLSTVTFVDSLLGVAVGGGGLLLISYLYHSIRKVEGMGGGDIKLLAMIGAFLGWKGVVLTLFFGSFSGAATGLVLALLKGKDLKYAIPFGPFLSLGALVYLFFGEGIFAWYMG